MLLPKIATIVVAAIMSVALVKAYILRPGVQPKPRSAATVSVGTTLRQTLPLDYKKNRTTLVLAVSTRCHFCNESAPFFRKLVEQTGNKIAIVAVLGESVPEAKKYFAEKEIHPADVRQAFLPGIGIGGTPTMLLVDRDGIVRTIWTGKLSPEEQEKALAALLAWKS